MRETRHTYYPFFRCTLLAAILLLFCTAKVLAVEEPYVNELKGSQVTAGNFVTVADEKFVNPSAWSLIQQNISVDDIISFEINFDTTLYFFDKTFSCTLNVNIYLYGNQSDTSQVTDSITNLSLVVRHHTAAGPYKATALYKFKGTHKYRVKINSISSPDLSPLLPIFRLKTQIIVNRKYTFQDNSTDTTQYSVSGNQLLISWVPTRYPGAEMFDLEYTVLDDSSEIVKRYGWDSVSTYNIPSDTLNKWFKFNCSRVITGASVHTISLVYSRGFILFRIRGVQINYPDEIRYEGNWNYKAQKTGSSQVGSAIVFVPWHEAGLNWQYGISFAEEGKKKEVISYFDGGYKNRQSVTLNNSVKKSIVQETIYDALGRPAVSILPVPTADSSIKYFKGFNRNLQGNPYSHLDLVFGSNCVTTAAPMTDTAGASKYYSPNNSFIGNYFFVKHIPKAENHPFAVTEYTPDNTGRIKAQGGVGKTFKIDSTYTTKYYYGKPQQKELDRLFGSEAGNASHYLKNMVMDPNGQISVSYVNAGGKTVATALAGATPANLQALPSNNAGAQVQLTQELMQPEDFARNTGNYSVAASATFLAPLTGTYTLNYQVDPLRLQVLYGQNKDSVICNNCYYDLLITVKDDCEQVVSNTTVSAGTVFDTACATPPPNLQGSINVSIAKIGDYYVTYALKVSKDALDYYDSTHLVKNTDIKKLNYFLLEELKNTDFYGCFNNCETCYDALGTKSEFFTRFKGLYLSDSVNFNTEDSLRVLGLYDSLYNHCSSLQPACAAAKSPCAEKLDMLKIDVSPGGQFALHDTAYHLLDSQTNVLLNRSMITFFTDPFGKRDSVMLTDINGEDSLLVDVKQLNDSLFLLHWKDSWADSLVRLHPEYCFYLWCTGNTTSYVFDRDVENLLDADSAKTINYFKRTDFAALLKVDPFFNTGGNGAAYYNRMNDSLRLFTRLMLRSSVPDKNILQFIDVVLYCRSQQDAWDNCNPDSSCRAPNREWHLYKTFYLNLKQQFYELARLANPQYANCTNCYIGNDIIGSINALCVAKPETEFTLVNMDSCYTSGPDTFCYLKFRYTGTTPVDHRLLLKVRYNVVGSGSIAYRNVLFKAGDSVAVFTYKTSLETAHVLDSVYCDTTFVPFNPTNCNFNCPGSVYAPYDHDSLSYYIQYSNPNQAPPTAAPDVYHNWQFFSVFTVKTGPASSCEFKNVWVGMYDSSCAVFECPPVSDFSTNLSTPFCDNGTKLSAYVQYNGSQTIPPGVSIEVDVAYDGGGIQWNYTFTLTSSATTVYTCTPYPVSGGSVQKTITAVRCYGIDSSMTCEMPVMPPSYCAGNPVAVYYKNKFRRFPEYVNTAQFITAMLSQNPAQQSGNIEQQTATECAANCEAQADSWIQTLSKCTTDPVKLAQLKAALIDVCSKGCSYAAPFGTSSIPNTISATYHSFEEAITGILGAGAINDSCTAELLGNPYPYDKQPGYINRVISETDYGICQRLVSFKSAYTASGFSGSLHRYLQSELGSDYSLDSLELDDLLNSCSNCNGILKNDIVLPIAFEPNAKPCLVCDSANVVLAGFNAKFSGIQISNPRYETLFSNYFNHRLGFALTYEDYRNYLDSCTVQGFTKKLCNQSMAVEDTTTDNSCMAEMFTLALTNAQNTYIAYIDSVRKDFRNAYLNRCMNVMPKLTMTATLYEYHYTLYYYDQAGSLVKTVPPEGVKILSSAQIDSVQTDRKYSRTDCFRTQDEVKFENNSHYYFANQSHFNTGTEPFTIESWIKFTNFSTQGILSFHNNGGGGAYGEGYLLQVRNDSLIFRIATGANNFAEGRTGKLSTTYTANTWLHLVVERVNDVNPMRIYVNGNAVAVYPVNNNFTYGANINPPSGTTFKIGGSPIPSGNTNFNGSVKQVRLYNRALLLSEIRQNYFGICNGPVNLSNLVFWSGMNEGSGRITDMLRIDTASYSSGALNWISNRMAVYPAHALVTTYQYNSFGQVLQQYSPDGDTSLFWHDRLGRLIASQNMEQLRNSSYSGSANRFSYTKYDVIGRPEQVGEKSGATDIRTINLFDTTAVKNWIASGTNKQITKTIYDNPINLYQSNITSRKRVVASVYTENSSDTEGDSTLYSYDILGNVKILVQHLKLLVAVDATNGKKRIDYDYDLVSGKVNKVSYQQGKGDQFFYKYLYDADNRVTDAKTSRDGLIWINDATYLYHLHGPLARTELGQLKVQGLDFAYTLQGWLKGMNGTTLVNTEYDMGNDATTWGNAADIHPTFSKDALNHILHYFGGDYKPIGEGAPYNVKSFAEPYSQLGANYKPLYNGNISGQYTNFENLYRPLYFNYKYDQLNRLISQDSYDGINEYINEWGTVNILEDYKERITYDGNGNILSYLRQGSNIHWPYKDMDNLSYRYKTGTNRLDHVDDVIGSNAWPDIEDQDTLNYLYDRIGNLKKDVAETLNNIDWTVYGKIKKIDKTSGPDIEYGYDAAGNRTTKKVIGASDKYTYYVRDAQGNVLAVYSKDGTAVLKWEEQHLYGSSRIGMWTWNAEVPSAPPVPPNNAARIEDSLHYGMRAYELNNHLGNVLVIVSDKKMGDSWDGGSTVGRYKPDVLRRQDYYPFGMPAVKRGENNAGYRYGFNGKENDDEVKGEGNQQDYGMRVYDDRLGRFLSVDPIASSFPELSPYQYASNRPIDGVDLDGQEYVKRIHYVNENYQVIHTMDIIYYKMDKQTLIAHGGTPSGIINAAGYGPEGKGIKHEYYFEDGVQAMASRWDLEQKGITQKLGAHGVYSGPGSITKTGNGTDYDFTWDPIDEPDAIAKRHDVNYANAAKDDYQGYIEDTRTLSADLQMVAETKEFLFRELFTLKPTGKITALESILTAITQKQFIGILADYKKWKTDYMIKNNLDPNNPNDIKQVSLKQRKYKVSYLTSEPGKTSERTKNLLILMAASNETKSEKKKKK